MAFSRAALLSALAIILFTGVVVGISVTPAVGGIVVGALFGIAAIVRAINGPPLPPPASGSPEDPHPGPDTDPTDGSEGPDGRDWPTTRHPDLSRRLERASRPTGGRGPCREGRSSNGSGRLAPTPPAPARPLPAARAD